MKLKSFTIKRNPIPYMETGWGNGYVILPKDHPYYGMHYDEIPVNVHGGLTYSEKGSDNPNISQDEDVWVVGFDTAHLNDNLHNWDEDAVNKETARLLAQLEAIEEI
jgi:hypothetical protein